MTRDQAVEYIQAHPKMFGDWPLEAILGRVQSFNDPDFYDPTLWVNPDPPPAARKPAAPRAPAPAPRAAPVAAPSSPAVTKAGMLGIPGPVWFTGLALALGLAYHKNIEKAVR